MRLDRWPSTARKVGTSLEYRPTARAISDGGCLHAASRPRLGFRIPPPCTMSRISVLPASRPRRARAILLSFALPSLALLGGCRTVDPGAPLVRESADRILRDIAYLADDRLEGRGTGTAGNDSAAAWLARRHAALGLRPVLADTARPECESGAVAGDCGTFLQRFRARGVELAHAGRPEGVATQNVVAMVPGRDPALAGEYVVVG